MITPIRTAHEFRKRVIFIVLVTTAVLLGVAFVWISRTILLLLFASILGALLLSTLTDAVSALLRLKRGFSFALVLILGISLLIVAVWIRGPQIIQEFIDLERALPLAFNQLMDRIHHQTWGQWLIERYSGGLPRGDSLIFALVRIGGMVSSTASTIAGIFLVMVASIYFAVEPDFYLAGLHRLTPRHYRIKLDLCLERAVEMLRSWILAKLVSMFAIGLFIASGLWALDVPLAGTLGIIAALLTFIPNIGALLSFAPAALLAFSISPMKGFLTLLLFCLAHLLEGNLVTPLAERTLVKLPPALTLAVQLLLFPIAGPLGLILAAPLIAATIGILQVLLPPEDMPVST
jgi:predicted PurR-regulated permease PerM